VALGTVATVTLIVLAPAIAWLFGEARLTSIVRVLGVVPFLSSLSVVHTSLLLRRLDFRRLAVAEVSGATIGGILGVFLALRGFGVWSLVYQTVCAASLISAGTWLAARWRPRRTFAIAPLRSIAAFSLNLTAYNVLNFVARNADNFLIGRYLGAQSLGLYDLAYRVMLSSLQFLSGAVTRALFPVYARMRDDDRRFAAAYLRVIAVTALIAFPLMFGLMGVAGAFVDAVFGPAWAPVVPLLLILSPVGALQAIGTTVGNIYQAKGRTDLLMRWAAIAGLLIVAAFMIGLQWGVIGVAACYALVSYALAYHLFEIPLRLIDMRAHQILTAVVRSLYCSGGMLVVLLLIDRILPADLGSVARLAMLVPVGIAVYSIATWFVNRGALMQLITFSRESPSPL
jgi:O-antigen/teichoic acid export membrane protein